MKIVEATWEKRNLGVNTIEVTIEQDDNEKEIDEKLKIIGSAYSVVKLPSTRPDLLEVIQNNGYRYIEDMVYVVNYLQEICRTSIQQRFYNAISVDKMNEADMELLYEEIRKGLFDSDRIFLDKKFTHDMAKERYINWVKDEYNRGTQFIKYIYKDVTIGFFALRELDNGHYTSFLGGIYVEHRKGGVGSIVKVPEVVMKLGGKKVSTSVSTNNASQLKSLVMNGYIPESILHTFIKHN